MRFLLFRFVFMAMIAVTVDVHMNAASAQNEVLVPEPEPIQPPENIDPNGLDEVPAEPSQDRLSELFGKLKKQTRPGPARATANLIWQEWIDSGSPTINLLMDRAVEAMRRKKTGPRRKTCWIRWWCCSRNMRKDGTAAQRFISPCRTSAARLRIFVRHWRLNRGISGPCPDWRQSCNGSTGRKRH